MTKQQYRDARKLIENPANWIQGHLDDDGGGFCALGACYHTAPTDDVPELYRAASEIGKHWSVAAINDTTDHATVLRMFDRAIELAKEA